MEGSLRGDPRGRAPQSSCGCSTGTRPFHQKSLQASARPLEDLVPRWLWDVPLTKGKVLFRVLASRRGATVVGRPA